MREHIFQRSIRRHRPHRRRRGCGWPFFSKFAWTIRTMLSELNGVYDIRIVRTKRRRRLPFSLRGRSGWFHPIAWKTENYEKYLRDSQCNDTVNRFNFILIHVLMTVELIPAQLQRTSLSFAAQMVRRLNVRANLIMKAIATPRISILGTARIDEGARIYFMMHAHERQNFPEDTSQWNSLPFSDSYVYIHVHSVIHSTRCA